MGNINQINNDTPQFVDKSKKANVENPGSNTFKQTFGEVLGNMESSKMEIVQTESLEELSAQNFKLPDPSASVSRETENLLEMFELYASKIEDNSISLKEIDSLLKDIQVDAKDLLEKVINSPEADEKVKSIAREFAVFASTEQIKFQRGDYLS
jgi:hypothetical protein